MPIPQLTHHSYTIGWLAPLAPSITAARQMLDEEHPPLPTAHGDENTYILGRIGVHNIVIACISNPGLYSASLTTCSMLSTFANIRFVLLVGVGVGAGAPPPPPPPPSHQPSYPLGGRTGEHDIRLGDVVVSQPEGAHGGVLDIGAGRWEENEEERFVVESHLNKPPRVLLNAAERLRSDHAIGMGEMGAYIRRVCEKAARTYHVPGREEEEERLFAREAGPASNSSDAEGRDGCLNYAGNHDCGPCEPGAAHQEQHLLLPRPQRASNAPAIHHGLIASGNAAVVSARMRDNLRDQYGVCCFETEAAAVMDVVPTLVVRGIASYADEHGHAGSRRWEAYAALTAAAYAKDLLRLVQAGSNVAGNGWFGVGGGTGTGTGVWAGTPGSESVPRENGFEMVERRDSGLVELGLVYA
ncbi:nucleoside phosphorylase domain-containing protein [Aspergillus egyptiacus]|nr:nucleoside phosphorylase domain-containing protein [Aspergillus egyptiacus]